MLKELVAYLGSLGRPETVKSESGQEFILTNEYSPLVQRMPEAFTVSTLSGFVSFVKADLDGWGEAHKMVAHVVSPTEVQLVSELWTAVVSPTAGHQLRATLLKAHAVVPEPLWDGRFYDSEQFIIAAQSRLVRCENRDKMLAVVGNIREESVRTVSDDGVTQEVTVREGINRKNFATLPNPIMLTPVRTFPEIEQVPSEFVFRAKDGPRFMLEEADGGVWRLEAIARVARRIEKLFREEEISIPVIC